MKKTLLFLSLLPAIASAQNWVAVYDSRRDEIPPFFGLIVDVSDTDRARNPDYYELNNERGHALRKFPTPYLLDVESGAKVQLPKSATSSAIIAAQAKLDEALAEQKPEVLAARAATEEAAATVEAVRLQVRSIVTNMSDSQLASTAALWPAWKPGTALSTGDIVRVGQTLFRVVQAHTAQSDWRPASTPALFTEITPPGTVAVWKQPTGAQDAYALDARVKYHGDIWQSTVANNVWEPGVYGWTKQ